MATYTPDNMPDKLQTGDIVNAEFSGEPKQIVLPEGSFRLEAWGAQGGYYNSRYGVGGLGGYAAGTLALGEETTLFLRVGQQGGRKTTTGAASLTDGWNGGGAASYYGGWGGGASGIRIGADDLLARVLVAGAGGGAQGRTSSSYRADGGYGGGESGGDGEYYNGNSSTVYNGKGGTQTEGGACGTYSTYPAQAGSFGQGGDAGRYSSTTYRGSGGGGGGWYGGGGGAYRYAGGGGGSGYVWSSATQANAPDGFLLTSDYYLTNTQNVGGNQTFAQPDGTSGVGREGDGYIRITVLAAYYRPKPPEVYEISYTTAKVRLSPMEGATSYRIYLNNVFTLQGDGLQYQLTDLTPGTNYSVSVSAMVDGAETDRSASVAFQTEAAMEIQIPYFVSASIVPNPCTINASFTISASVQEETKYLFPAAPYSGTFYSGEEEA